MTIYLIAFSLTLIFSYFASNSYKKSTNNNVILSERKPEKIKFIIYFILAFFPLFFISAVRYGIGTDYFFTYVPNFYNIQNGSWDAYTEKGFVLLNKLILVFTNEPQWLFVITSFIYVGFLINVVVKHSKNPIVSVIVVFISCIYFISLNNIRQSIAAIIILAAFPYIRDRKFPKFLIAILFASIFHITSFMMLVVYFIVNNNFIRRNIISLACIVTALLPVLCKLFEIIIYNTKYYYYFESAYNDGNTTTINILYNLFFLILSLYVLGKDFRKNKEAYVLIVMQFIAFWVSAVSIFIPIPELINRISSYFQSFQILLVPFCFEYKKSGLLRWGYLTTYIILYVMYMIYFIVLNNAHEVLPYKWIFNL